MTEPADLNEERRQVRAAISAIFTQNLTADEVRERFPLAHRCHHDNRDRFWAHLRRPLAEHGFWLDINVDPLTEDEWKAFAQALDIDP